MYTNFTIYNNTNSPGGRHQETLKRLAKNVIEQSEKKERNINQVFVKEDYFTKQYIPAEVYICNITGKACLNNNIENSIRFLNKQATIKNLNIKESEIVDTNNNEEIFEVNLDNTKNIFAA